MVKMLYANGAISMETIKAFEEKYNIELPPEYRSFLHEFNGGETTESLYKATIKNKPNTLVLNELLGITGKNCDLEWTNNTWNDDIPAGLFVIGVDPGGNGFLIGLCGTEFEGKVYFLLHDLSVENPMDRVFWVANSFNEFLEGLFENIQDE